MLINKDFIKLIPKTDLHLHLDGSLRLDTLIDLAKQKNIQLPSYTKEGLIDLVFKEKYNNLDEYLKGFSYTTKVMDDYDSLKRISYELAMDAFSEGVRYIEVRFAPQLHMHEKFEFEDVMKSIDDGLKLAQVEINQKVNSNEPEFNYGIIVCAMRFCNEHFSQYYKNFFTLHKYSSNEEVIRLASLELIKATVKLKNNSDIKIVGFDIAGSEYGYPASNHIESYDFAHKNFIHKTVHSGEAYGPESIFQAITMCHADRIGHGLFLFDEDMIYDNEIKDKKKYVNDLANYISERRITIEVCLTSNLQTTPSITNIQNHSFGKMLKNNISVSLCTDNRLVSHTNSCNEIELALKNFDISINDLRNIIIYGFKRSFFYGSYTEKRKYVRKCIDYFDLLLKKFNLL